MQILSLLFLVLATVHGKSLSCDGGINVRKNWVELSQAQQADFVSAYRTLMHSSTNGKGGDFFVDHFTKLHASYGGGVHGTCMFFPWHRYYMSAVEQKLQEAGRKKSIFLPFWDWSLESQSLATSPIWQTFGGDGVLRKGGFAGLQVQYPKPHNIWRSFNDGKRGGRKVIGVAASFSMIEAHLDLKDFEKMQDEIEYIHGSVHVIVGGDMGDVKTSPNDPLFYLHHCFVDRIWWRWQLRGHARDFGGVNYFDSRGAASTRNERRCTLQDLLYPFVEWKVADVLDTKALCYTYSSTKEEQYEDQISMGTGGSGGGAAPGGALNALASIFQTPPTLSTGPPAAGGKMPTPADENVRIMSIHQLGPNEQKCNELFKVMPASPITAEWMGQNNLNPNTVSRVEERNKKIFKELDQVKGFISPSSLYNNLDLMIGLMEANERCFKATVNQGVVVIRVPDSELKDTSTMRVYKMQNRLIKTLKTDNLSGGFKQVANEIEQVIQVTPL